MRNSNEAHPFPRWICEHCGHENTGHTETWIDSCGDSPILVYCDICTSAHFDGEIVDTPRESKWLTKKHKDEVLDRRTSWDHLRNTQMDTPWVFDLSWLRNVSENWRNILLAARTEHKLKRNGTSLNLINQARRNLAQYTYATELLLREENQ